MMLKPRMIWKSTDGFRLVARQQKEPKDDRYGEDAYDVIAGEYLDENAMGEPVWLPMEDGIEAALGQFALDYANVIKEKTVPPIQFPFATGQGGYSALVKEERELFRAIEEYMKQLETGTLHESAANEVLLRVQVWWIKVIAPQLKKGG